MSAEPDLAPARTVLESERRRIASEISAYPGPVAGCDAQFNHLLDLRTRLARALAELDRPYLVPTPRTPD